MVVKRKKTLADDFGPWNSNEVENVEDEKRSIARSVNLLLRSKNISQANLRQLPSHLFSSPSCQCQRSFHLFCTDLVDENDRTNLDMINVHPAPRSSERGRVPTPYRKGRHRHREENDQSTTITSRSEPCQVSSLESQLLERKLRVPHKFPMRTTSLNVPVPSSQATLKYSPSIQVPKQSTSIAQLHIRASSMLDQSPSTSQLFPPRGPPPSPKTPTQDLSMVISHSFVQAPLRAVSITPRARIITEPEKKLMGTTTTTNTISSSSVKTVKYEDHAREYLSASDCSDNENDEDITDGNDDKDIADALTITKPKFPVRQASLSRPGTALRDRLATHNANHYLSLAQVYYSSLDVYKNLAERSRQRYKSQTRSVIPTNENIDAYSTITKTTTNKTVPAAAPPSKSVFGFSKTASSMHFGHAAGRLGLHGSFEKWPRPLSRRTPFERKQEVTTLRLVTLPLVTS